MNIYDGTGYPHNLVGKQIPLVGRIMHVCDIFGALISNRDYREGFDVETALDIMIDEVKNFDMKVFLAFQRVAFSDGVMETVMEKAIWMNYLRRNKNDYTGTKRNKRLVWKRYGPAHIFREYFQRFMRIL